jgi:effector-binding domain-containing protein
MQAEARDVAGTAGVQHVDDAFALAHADGLQAAGAPWEQYISDPANTPQDKLLTYLYWPVK